MCKAIQVEFDKETVIAICSSLGLHLNFDQWDVDDKHWMRFCLKDDYDEPNMRLIWYKGMIVKQPFFEGKGNHSVAKLEEICKQFKEYCHQQAIIKQNCMKHIVELKFGVEFPQHEA